MTERLAPPGSAVSRLRALRGATTVDTDSPDAITKAVSELIEALQSANGVSPAQILSAIFTATPDVRAFNPATVARASGWSDVPMLCVSEMPVANALSRCIRVLVHVELESSIEAQHQYLRGAQALRPDRTGNA